MRSLADIRTRTPKSEVFRGQAQHAMMAVLLTAGAYSLLKDNPNQFLGLSAICWASIAIAAPLIHQIMVAVVFRLQLHFDIMNRLFGGHALKIWGIMFMPLLISRPLLLLTAGIADFGSLGGGMPVHLLGAVLILPAIWGMHSVIKYFTINRALGGDHFYDKYLNMPMVNQGAFKYTSNAMYGIVFIGLWGLALLTLSWNALVIALFNHAYIWVHMYCTEDPDMKILYSDEA